MPRTWFVVVVTTSAGCRESILGGRALRGLDGPTTCRAPVYLDLRGPERMCAPGPLPALSRLVPAYVRDLDAVVTPSEGPARGSLDVV
jgi:hypothetical protein